MSLLYSAEEIVKVMNHLEGIGVRKEDLSAITQATALFEIAEAIQYMTRRLGTGNAATDMGALEFIGSELANIAMAIDK